MNKTQFIKRIADVDVDGIRCINHYRIYDMYEEFYEDEYGEYAKTNLKLIDEFDYPWDMMNRDGGIAAINEEIKNCYGIEA